ncbi:DUF924 domain-containing protein [Leptolyngbya sp. FACHB-541]|uniref:DUF924 family protein n=1 Tax=Leptolyngbya sp. FACHB-541 TaxID=2692810 RepID=UPI001682A146|nr:DUF924 family protein [Leptolyngbya sp. FACHB-541]MBD1996155.1 DUF924 domain-containing protein [Leptolyngbya sp. FACHB-541]
MAQIDDVLNFWFADPQTGLANYAQWRKVWFIKNAAFDQQVRDRFLTTYEQAAAGKLDHWQDSPAGCLALILVLDQFPRNMFRRDPRAFATDLKAVETTQRAIAREFHQQLKPLQQLFLYLPLEHSENLDPQNHCVALFHKLVTDQPELGKEFEDTYSYAVRHQAIVKRFGRFPHRNEILGRETTPEEAEFLKEPGSSF